MQSNQHPALRAAIIAELSNFVTSRPGFDPRNYGSWSDYQSDARRSQRDRRDAETLLRAVAWSNITADELIEAARGSRITIRTDIPGELARIDYCTGQYYPTEYRAAVCRLLSSALWNYWREGLTDQSVDAIHRTARHALGFAIARRWFI